MTSAQLQTLPGIHPQRADVLPAGALILHTILEACDAQECVVSTAGLRYGAMMHGA
jgi:exopolyphosphatase/guanosine-5'-triphosphate,3'-diphosphate pyrophosphatase